MRVSWTRDHDRGRQGIGRSRQVFLCVNPPSRPRSFDLSDGNQVKLVAVDDVGNRAEAGFIDRFTPKAPSEGTIELTDGFMSKVVPEIINNTPGFEDQGTLLENYVHINRRLREENRQRLVELGGQTAEELMWYEPFLPMPGGQVMSPFATRRSYMYDGRKVDEQFHLGFDLASTQKAPVPAANDGRVLLAEYHGIYGNAVVLDHGYGVMTLYGHLSSFDVQQGQTVERGQPVGRTGQTGLAGGDHLHYEVMLRGHPTTPVEWWDRKGLTDRLSRKLGEARTLGKPQRGGEAAGEAEAPQPAAER
jgi:murein DD-endopeptidase MepM/ murein hydrolase activator NlpD